jgi:hypothetical protein
MSTLSVTTLGAFDGISVKNVYNNPITKRAILYNSNEGAYDNMLKCRTGVANIDNTCLCPGSANSTPFYLSSEKIGLDRFFSPEHPIPPPTHAARCLMAERRPLHPNAPYEPYLGACSK